MDMSMHIEPFNLVKSLEGKYKESDKKELLQTLEQYVQQKGCSYKYAYEMLVEGNPSYSTYNRWRVASLKE
ncbi:MAG: hypothetical protein JXQ67_09590 [Campylobacterales bacterium]|nr:hypothetical protein [Campylobacterales bacterium]